MSGSTGAIFCSLSRHVSRELNQKQSGQNSNEHSASVISCSLFTVVLPSTFIHSFIERQDDGDREKGQEIHFYWIGRFIEKRRDRKICLLVHCPSGLNSPS